MRLRQMAGIKIVTPPWKSRLRNAFMIVTAEIAALITLISITVFVIVSGAIWLTGMGVWWLWQRMMNR
jgi:hypothetical protein